MTHLHVPAVLPCPFCGKTNIRNYVDDGQHWLRCVSCGATGPITTKYSGEEDTPYTDWNSRTSNTVAHLRQLLQQAEDELKAAWVEGAPSVESADNLIERFDELCAGMVDEAVRLPNDGLLYDGQWVNIVNHRNGWEGWGASEAVHEAVKMTLAKIAENLAGSVAGVVEREVLQAPKQKPEDMTFGQLLAALHAEVWEAAASEDNAVAYDEAGEKTAEEIVKRYEFLQREFSRKERAIELLDEAARLLDDDSDPVATPSPAPVEDNHK